MSDTPRMDAAEGCYDEHGNKTEVYEVGCALELELAATVVVAQINGASADRLARELAAMTAEAERLKAERNAALTLLRIAKCPNCDGCGFTVREVGGCDMDGQHDTRECVQERCQWCVKRDGLLDKATGGTP